MRSPLGAATRSVASVMLVTASCALLAQPLGVGAPPAAAPREPTVDSRTLNRTAPKAVPFVVPPVVERPFADEAGPKVAVSEVRVTDSLSRKGKRLRAAVDQVIEQALSAQPADGYTVNQLQLIANEVAKAYSEIGGFVLAQAFVPEQTVTDGVVELRVVEGFLEAVMAEENDIFSDRALRRAFRGLRGKPVRRKHIESALLRVNDVPGLDVFGVFSPGEALGGTALTLRAQDEQRVSLNTFSDNHGNSLTGEYRAY
ncbi:MAG: POTRA domain-containing protein, partial [Pseudomonadota bacterium]